MKTKALVLGAHPPFEGPWVSLEGAEKWKTVVEGTGKFSFSLKGGNGNDKSIRVFEKETQAEAIQIIVSGEGTITAYIESVEE